MNFAAKTANADEDGYVPVDAHGNPAVWCEWCGNEGIVMLEGEEVVGSTRYSRGSAPCRWCLQGELRFAGWSSPTRVVQTSDRHGRKHVYPHRRIEPRADFTEADVTATPEWSGRFLPDAAFLRERLTAGISMDALKSMFPQRIWPEEWPQDAPPPLLDPVEEVEAGAFRNAG